MDFADKNLDDNVYYYDIILLILRDLDENRSRILQHVYNKISY